jgi:hypothetical protein
MTQIIFDRSQVSFVTPRGTVRTSLQHARKIADASGNQHELEEALQNPDVPVVVIASTRARGLNRPRFSNVCQ